MKNTRIYYFHTLNFTFKSAQTIQVVKDYYYLSKLGVEVSIYGTFRNKNDYLFIKRYLRGSKVKIIAKEYSYWNKLKLKIICLSDLLKDTSKKIIVTRHYRKLATVLKLKKYGLKVNIFHEMHEESFPYLFKKHISKENIKSLFLHKDLDSIIFTNYSQQIFFEREFEVLPSSFSVLPNGVEIDKFNNISMESNFVITYAGGFNSWKNVDLVFESLSLLESKYTLRISGGKGDTESLNYINSLTSKYMIDPSRVNYLGFIQNQNFPNEVLNKSNVLLLPLGDNIQSKYLTSPMKLFEYMATKIPVLGINFPSVSLITNDKIFLSKNDAKEFSENISNICETSQKNLDFKSMNELAAKYSYSERSIKFYNEVISVFS